MSLAGLRKLTEEGVRFQVPYRRVGALADARTQHGDPAPAGQRHRDVLRRMPGPARDRGRGGPSRCACRCAGRSGRAMPSATGPAMRCSASMQGGVTRELREESAEALSAIGFDGYAVGGLAVGEGQEAMFGVLDYAPGYAAAGQAALSDGGGQARRHRGRGGARHRHDGLRAAVALGAHGAGLDAAGAGQPAQRPPSGRPAPVGRGLHLPGLHAAIRAPICTMCNRAQEIIASMLLTWHNLHYYQELMQGLRGCDLRTEAGGVRGGVPRAAGRGRYRAGVRDQGRSLTG